MYPTALYSRPLQEPGHDLRTANEFESSQLNPKSRPNSFNLPPNIQWRIDGGEADGTRFFAVPTFAIGRPPLRIDVYIPDQLDHPPHLMEVLESNRAMLLSGRELEGLPISRIILQRLHSWLNSIGPDLEVAYFSMPFGSRIIMEAIAADVGKIPVHLVPNYDVENQWLSLQELQAMWRLPEGTWPPVLDHSNLQLVRQIHEAITVVHIRGHPKSSEMFAFKAVSVDVKYMYHELKMLLTMQPHDHIMHPALYVVTKKCRFGGKVGVCGFILRFLPHGTLRDALSDTKAVGVGLSDRLRWTGQLLSALMHIQSTPAGFYTDLKPNNILFSDYEGEMGVLLVDFEQRGSWYSWSPPEVYYIEYLEILASSEKVDAEHRERYSNFLARYISDWKPSLRNERYVDSKYGFSRAWGALDRNERKAAQVFMVGKLLWCIFEHLPFPNSCVTVETFREKPSDQSFPEFRRTPTPLRECIRRCTSGAPEWNGHRAYVVRSGVKLFPRGRMGQGGEPRGTWSETQEAARTGWQHEVDVAERFIVARIKQKEATTVAKDSCGNNDDGILGFMRERPSLEEIELIIKDMSG